MSSPSFLRGIWVPLITPFIRATVDHAGLARLTAALAASGIAGFVVCGSTGEAATLSDAEQLATLDTVLAAAAGLPVLMGLGGVATSAVREKLLRVVERPIAGALISAPPYVRPSQAGLLQHFSALADASPKPVLLYDIPGRTGVRIETATLLALAAHPRIVGVKDCSGDLDHLQALLSDGRLAVLCGDDHQIFASLCLGAAGAIAASAHLQPQRFVQMQRLLDQGRLPEARALWRRLRPLATALFAEPNPALVKAALAPLHDLSDELRPPMARATDAARDRVAAALAA
ncbi:MAG: 4-hydroxy-tetrahydrodipicolinate synthase [Pseudomonadota bacterium]